ncbi:MAG: Ig-like domain-containing protein [Flavobacteriaceae bacterium]
MRSFLKKRGFVVWSLIILIIFSSYTNNDVYNTELATELNSVDVDDLTLDVTEDYIQLGYTYMGEFGGMDYYVSNTATTWTDAVSQAVALGGNLVTISDISENTFVRTELDNAGVTGSAWIGLNDVDTDGTFVWQSGELFSFNRWNSGQPNGFGSQDGIVILSGGNWDDQAITLSNVYVIEVNQGFFDTDGDGVDDHDEDLDDDNDGILDAVECPPVDISSYTSSGTNEGDMDYGSNTVTVNGDTSNVNGGTRVTIIGGTGTTPVITYTFSTPISGLVVELDDIDIGFETLSGFSIFPNSVTGDLNINGGTVESSAADGAGTLVWENLPAGTTSISYTLNRTSSGFASFIDAILPKTDTDGDGIEDCLDLDSDNDGIPDNIEAQTTAGYDAPNADDAATYTTNNGVNSAYLGGLTPENTDGTDNPDYLDSDSDNDGIPDIEENGDTDNMVSNIDTDSDGLDDNFEGGNTNDGYDVNDEINDPATDLPNTNGTGDVDYREALDTDGDGVTDSIDLDDDNDGILDTDEDIIPSGYTFLGSFNGNYYYVSNSGATWTDAVAQAVALGGNLVTIGSLSENTFVRTELDNEGVTGSVWIGYNDVDTDGAFVWQSGEPFSYENWIGGQPNGFGSQDGVVISSTSQWDDQAITLSNVYIVEVSPGFADTDNDGVPNIRDLDSDDDGIPDNIEAQTTSGYDAPNADDAATYLANNGVNSAYLGGLTPENTDGADNPDYLDSDSDNDGTPDIEENGDTDNTTSGTDTDGDGLDDNFDTVSGFDVNDAVTTGDLSDLETIFGDADGDINAGGNLDYRDSTSSLDTDNDGVFDETDLDDDNDGILDSVENTCDNADIIYNATDTYGLNYSLTDLSGSDIDVTFTSALNSGATSTIDGTYDTDGMGLTYRQQWEDTNITDPNETAVFNYTFSREVLLEEFIVKDIDRQPTFIDAVRITALDKNGLAVTLNYTAGGDLTVSPDGYYYASASGNSADTDTAHWLTVTSNGAYIKELIITQIPLDGISGSTPGSSRIIFGNLDLCADIDTDRDGIPDVRDLDSDNDGIPDNIEAQTTSGYIVPNADNAATYTTNNGVNSAYLGGLTPENTDSADDPDYLDSDSDNDGTPDIEENGDTDNTTSGTDTDGDGLDDNFDTVSGFDVNDAVTTGDTSDLVTIFGDADNDIPFSGDLDYRDDFFNMDTDQDGVPDSVDLDDDNDGILDTDEDIIPSGYTFLGSFNGNYYYVSNSGATWTDAVTQAVALGGNLVTMNNASENTFVRTELDNAGVTGSAWIGFNDVDTDGTFVWQSGEPVSFFLWSNPQPDGAGSQDGVVILSGGLWDDQATSLTHVYVIEASSGFADADSDGVPNIRDLDSDNDGIPDNIEAQTTAGYTAPNADNAATYKTNNGVNSAYLGGLTPENTDSTDDPDYLDLDSDEDGVFDVAESVSPALANDGSGKVTGVVGDNGLVAGAENTDDYTDVNGSFDDTQTDNFTDTDGDGEVDYRDDTETISVAVTGTEISASPTSIVADGITTSTITVQLKDANGNNITEAGVEVQFATTNGTLSTTGLVLTDANGQAQVTLTSPTSAGSADITAQVDTDGDDTVDGTVQNGSPAKVTFTAGAISVAATGTEISASPTSIVADGITTSTITVQLKDANGNNITETGVEVQFAATNGTLSTTGVVQTDANGQAQVTLTSPTSAGSANITAQVDTDGDDTVDGTVQNGSPATVTFTAGAISVAATGTQIGASPTSIEANGITTSTITVQLKDANGNNITEAGVEVQFATTNGTLSTTGVVQTDANGQAQVTLTSPTSAGSANITAQIDTDGDNTVDGTVQNGSPAQVTFFLNIDTDGDGVFDETDLDDDNDGILDVDENQCSDISNADFLDTDDLVNPEVTGVNLSSLTTTAGEQFTWATDANSDLPNTATHNIANNPSFTPGPGKYVTYNSGSSALSYDVTVTFSQPQSTFQIVAYDIDGDGVEFLDTFSVLPTSLSSNADFFNSGTSVSSTSVDQDIILTWSLASEVNSISFRVFRAATFRGVAFDVGFPAPCDTDGDGVPNIRDLDSDNDGIPDNIEAQTTAGYVAPNADNAATYTTNNGVNSAYLGGLTPENTDGTGDPDYLDLDSDDDGVFDVEESVSPALANDGSGKVTGVVGDNGLVAGAENTDDYTDVNGSFDDTQTDNFTDTDGDGDVDYRDDTETISVAVTGTEISASPTSIEADGITTSTITVQLKDANGNNITEAGVEVQFATTNGTLSTTGVVLTDSNGQAQITLTSPTSAGSADITAQVDTDGDDTVDGSVQNGSPAQVLFFSTTDTDDDGVDDDVDLDDDNDGILDAVECAADISTFTNSGANEGNMSAGSNTVTVNAGTYNASLANDPARIRINSGTGTSSTITYTFSIPITSLVIEIDDIDTGSETLSAFSIFPDTVTDDLNINGAIVESTAADGRGTLVWNNLPTGTTSISYVINRSLVGFGTVINSISPKTDTDGDGIADCLDLDSDNDGIPDNIEAQTTAGYIAPNADDAATYTTNNGVNSAYLGGLTPENTDGTDNSDYLDSDSDNDGIPDIEENGDTDNTVTGTDTDSDGLDDNFEGSDTNDGYDVNDEINDPATDLPNTNGTGDVDYREALDTDGDGVTDSIDLDDDNDGILDSVENDAEIIPYGTLNYSFYDGIPPGETVDNITNLSLTATGSTISFSVSAVAITHTASTETFGIILTGFVNAPSTGTYTFSTTSNDGSKLYIDGTLVVDNNVINGTTNSGMIALTEGLHEIEIRYFNRASFSQLLVDWTVPGGSSESLPFTSLTPTDYGNFDGDGIRNSLDLDSDNDGIPDNIEAQTTAGYIAPNADDAATYLANNGMNSAYLGGLTPENTDGTDNPDYLDSDSDNDGTPDIEENGDTDNTISGTDTDSDGLDDNFDTVSGFDVNDAVTTGDTSDLATVFGDADNDITFSGDVDYRDDFFNTDTDQDGVPDSVDLDDDNDGILDSVENTCDNADIIYNATDTYGLNYSLTDLSGSDIDVGFTSALNSGVTSTLDGTYDTDGMGLAYRLVWEDTNITDPNETAVFNYTFSREVLLEEFIVKDIDRDPAFIDAVRITALDQNGFPVALNYTAGGDLTVSPDGFYYASAVGGSADTDTTHWLTVTSNGAYIKELIITQIPLDGISGSTPGSSRIIFASLDLCADIDTDRDGIPNVRDLDSDNDGIPDNIEAQTTTGYVASNADNAATYSANNGVNSAYLGGLTPENTDGTDDPDYLDLDTDNDGIFDVEESVNPALANDGSGRVTGTVGTNGLVSDAEASDDYTDVNGSFDDTQTDNFIDANNNASSGGDVDYREINSTVMITQIYQTSGDKAIELTNISTTDLVLGGTINIAYFSNVSGSLEGVAPTATYSITGILAPTQSVLIESSEFGGANIHNSPLIEENPGVTAFDGGNDVIILSLTTNNTAWSNRYDVIENFSNTTSYVRSDEVLSGNIIFTSSEWVAFVDDALDPYRAAVQGSPERHAHDPLISEVNTSSSNKNQALGYHRSGATNRTANAWSNGEPDRSRRVSIDEDYAHTGSNLSARQLTVVNDSKLSITDNALIITEQITLTATDDEIRLIGTSQLITTHTNTSQIIGNGKLYVDQNSDVPSLYRYNYFGSPVNSAGLVTYTVSDVLKDGTDPTSELSTAIDINFIGGFDGDGATSPISLAEYWIYTYGANAAWTQKFSAGIIPQTDGFIFKGPGQAQNYTYVGTPKDGTIQTTVAASTSYLLGNPFASAIRSSKFIEDNLTSTTGTLYFWEQKENINGEEDSSGHNFGGYVGGYAIRNISMGLAANNISGPDSVTGVGGLGEGIYEEPAEYIAIGQGFFVGGSGTGGTIEFNNSQREYIPEGPQSIFFRNSSEETEDSYEQTVGFKLGMDYISQEEEYHRQIGISFLETNTFGFEKGYDSEAFDLGATDIYWDFENNDTPYFIAGVQKITDDLEIPLSIVMDYDGEIKLTIDEWKNIDREIYLLDKVTETTHLLNDEDLILTLVQGEYKERFYIAFGASTLSNPNETLLYKFQLFVDQDNRELIVKANQDIKLKELIIYDLLGKEVMRWEKLQPLKKQEAKKFKMRKNSQGIYLVQLRTEKGTINKKVYLNFN